MAIDQGPGQSQKYRFVVGLNLMGFIHNLYLFICSLILMCNDVQAGVKCWREPKNPVLAKVLVNKICKWAGLNLFEI